MVFLSYAVWSDLVLVPRQVWRQCFLLVGVARSRPQLGVAPTIAMTLQCVFSTACIQLYVFRVRRSRTVWHFHIDGSEQIRWMLESRHLSRTRGRQDHRPRVGRTLWRLMEVLCCFGPERYSTLPWLQLLCGSHGKSKPAAWSTWGLFWATGALVAITLTMYTHLYSACAFTGGQKWGL